MHFTFNFKINSVTIFNGDDDNDDDDDGDDGGDDVWY
jgi:hypothetical protein